MLHEFSAQTTTSWFGLTSFRILRERPIEITNCALLAAPKCCHELKFSAFRSVPPIGVALAWMMNVISFRLFSARRCPMQIRAGCHTPPTSQRRQCCSFLFLVKIWSTAVQAECIKCCTWIPIQQCSNVFACWKCLIELTKISTELIKSPDENRVVYLHNRLSARGHELWRYVVLWHTAPELWCFVRGHRPPHRYRGVWRRSTLDRTCHFLYRTAYTYLPGVRVCRGELKWETAWLLLDGGMPPTLISVHRVG